MYAGRSMEAGDPAPVLIAYDGSELARAAVTRAAQLLATRRAIVLTVWQVLEVNAFFSAGRIPLDERVVEAVEREATATADEGAALAREAGLEAEPVAIRGVPIWRTIVDFASEREAGVVVLGSHGRTGVSQVMLGSVAAAVAQHSKRAVLIVHGD